MREERKIKIKINNKNGEEERRALLSSKWAVEESEAVVLGEVKKLVNAIRHLNKCNYAIPFGWRGRGTFWGMINENGPNPFGPHLPFGSELCMFKDPK